MHLAQPKEAITFLEGIEKQHPGRYETAVNLGTAYELAGDNQRALQWIREGMRRNPRAHSGTEWIHARILEAKLAIARDPHWLETHSVLGRDFGTTVVPHKPPGSMSALANAIEYQLRERMEFVKPPDAIVADLMFDCANAFMLGAPIENAEAYYDAALKYGTPRAGLARQRMSHIRGILKKK